MHRFLKALLLLVTCTLLSSAAFSQTLPIVQVSGRLSQGQLKVFTKDTLYRIVGQYTIAGTLLVEPGTTVEFTTNGRLIDSVGGRIIADGELQAIWNRNTSAVTAYPNRYCDTGYMRANVSIGARPEITITGPSHMDIVPYILFYYANGRARCASDPNLANTPYRRNVDRAPIIFRGRPINQFSPEWGHIVVLPGADTAFFRNCQFVNFRKETRAVSLTDFYAPNAATGYSSTQITAGSALNTAMRNLTTGGGGAMTVFSSKTWLLNCRFDSNFARYHGGAVQFLQAPFDATGLFYPAAPGQPLAPTAYPAVNPETFDLYGGTVATPFGPLRAFTVTTPAGGATQFRQTYDDGRMAINNGRVRRMYFRDNRAVVSDTTQDVSGYRDNISAEVIYPAGGLRKNEAFGGAMYISGRRLITVYLGRGTALDSLGILPGGDPTDTMVFERNHAVNYQAVNASSNGARGGALYVGDSTNMHFQLSRFLDNFTAAPNVAMTDYIGRGRMSQGGGIYMSQNAPVLTALGNVRFRNNKAGQGGGIYIAAVGDPTLDFYLSPVLGDSAYFISNKAEYDGGAIYTQRNTLFAAPYLITIDSTQPGRPMIDRRILFDSNAAGMTGGAVVIDNRTNPSLSRARVENVLFRQNSVDSAKVADVRLIKIFDPVASPISPANENGTHTVRDVYNMPAAIVPDVLGGGAIYSLNGNTNFFRSVEFFQNRARFGNGGAISMILPGRRDNRYFLSAGDSAYDFNTGLPLDFRPGAEPTDQRQMTRFIMNMAEMDSVNTPVQRNPHGSTLGDPNRNGTGLGGAVYINDLQTQAGTGTPRTDSVLMHRVRMEMDTAWSGSAVYSDNYDLRVIFNKSLVANNVATSTVGAKVDTIQNYLLSPAASRIAGATFYGEIEGPIPSERYHTNANSIYDNKARFIIRLPDAPPGTTGVGFSGIDTLRGNFWGRTEAPVTTTLPSGTLQNTFYIQGDSCTLPLKNPAIPEQQGPFESTRKFGDPPGRYYTYTPVPIGVIPDTLLFEGRVYDIYDKGLDIKAVDYSAPRMAPIEDFSVGIPKRLLPFQGGVYAGKVVRRMTRDPFIVDIDPDYATLQREFIGNHPIGYPLFLESHANYIGNDDTTNNDRYSLNYTVFFVINVETGEIIRSNSRQLAEGNNEFRSRVEFVADSINRDPLQRRTYEGRAAFSIGEIARLAPAYYLQTPGQLPAGLANRADSLRAARLAAAAYEDSVAVAGRRYGGRITPVLELGGNGFTYENRLNPPTFADIYAGERYRALPVLTGDRIWVISRTELWNTQKSITQVVNDARFTGLEFMIDNNNSIAAPIIFGQRDSLEARMPSELRNTRFLIEDTVYTASDLVADTSRILEVTANDLNGFFDPRSIFFPDRYTALRFEYNTLQEFPGGLTIPNSNPAFVRLASWLKADTVFPSDPVNQRDSARGFLRFYGTPHNPDVVPGGELLEVRVSNYPPGVRTIDSLRGLVGADVIARYVFLYPPYFNCQVYDAQRSRYLQQDTVDVGGASTASYRLRIFVQDTPPTFLSDVSPCGNQGRTNLAVANLTNKLRFNFDVETDDELEDNNAEGEGWAFPYGRTTYGFVFTDRNIPSPNDSNATDDVREIRPVWMADSLLHNTSLVRDRGVTVLTKGNIIIRIDSAQAIEMLRNPAQANNAFNLDTMFTVVANDGHTGQNKRDMRAIVNVAPQLLPVPPAAATLPRAKEDFDYNPQLLDRTRGVVATDLNFNQRLRYYLVYSNDALNEPRFQTNVPVLDSNGNPKINTATTAYVRRDGCYFEAGLFTAPKTTPDWLKVNTNSGLLYGTPGLNDAPRTTTTGGPETVTVVVEDEFGLTDVRTYTLEVDSTQHRPRLVGRPPVQCVDPSKPYSDSLCVSDRDLGRTRFGERLTLEVISPSTGFTVTPSTINGPITGNGADTCINLRITAPSINDTGKVRVVIKVTDAAGNTDTLGYEISVSEPVIFSMPVRIRNTNIESGSNATQELVFGIARNATTGEDPSALGRLDSNYCEYELPPQPPRDVFDSRWTIPTRTGVLRNIFPENPSAGQGALTWKGLFQPGFLEGGSVNYPVVICWSISDAQKAPQPLHIMDPLAGAVFRIDMKSPTGFGVKLPAGGGVTLRVNGDTACVEILASSSLTGFHITYGLTVGVNEPVTGVSGYTLSANAPNPFSNTTEITFFSPKRGDARLEVFNMNGDLVRTLVNSSIEAGQHSVIWNGTDEKGTAVASGTYTYRLTAGSNILTRTMVLVK
jgi:predicted outer membrane repeat protein